MNYLVKIISKGMGKTSVDLSPSIIVLVMKQVIAQRDCISTIWLKDMMKKLNSTQKVVFKEVKQREKIYKEIKINMIQVQTLLTKDLISNVSALIYHHQQFLRNK